MTTNRSAPVYFANASSGEDIVLGMVCHVNMDRSNKRSTLIGTKFSTHGQHKIGSVNYKTGIELTGLDLFKIHWLTADGKIFTTGDVDPYHEFLAGVKMLMNKVGRAAERGTWLEELLPIFAYVIETGVKIAPKLAHIVNELKKSNLHDLSKDKNKLENLLEELADIIVTLMEEPRWEPLTIEDKAAYLTALGMSHKSFETVISPGTLGLVISPIVRPDIFADFVLSAMGVGNSGYVKFNLHPSDDAGIEINITKNNGVVMVGPSGTSEKPYHRMKF